MSSKISSKGTISLTRGDTFYAIIKLYNKNDEEVTLSEGDSVRFAVKEDYDLDDVLLEIDIPVDTMTLRIAPEDTKNLDFGTYVYDVQVTFANGDVDTVIPRKTLNILEEVI